MKKSITLTKNAIYIFYQEIYKNPWPVTGHGNTIFTELQGYRFLA